ncbi:MAG: hypothetical protein ACREBU_21135 [Nitrososphaera sp.]
MPPWPPTPARETEHLIGEITIAGFDNIAERALLEPLTQVAKLTDGNIDNDGAACDKSKEIINTVNEKESAGSDNFWPSRRIQGRG